ncbi:MAG: hypothetical protein WCC23_17720 [Acinetobacter calcoaceticus]
MSERYRVNQQYVDIYVESPKKTKVVGIENNLTNYSTFIPPEPDSPEGMYCPRISCRRWIYRDNKECEYCKYDIRAYWYRIDLKRRKEFFDRRVNQMYYIGAGCLVLAFILLQFTSSIFVGLLFIVGLLIFAAASNAKFEE